MNELLTIDEVAEELRLCELSVREAIANGDLKACKVGPSRGKYVVRRLDLDRYVKEGKLKVEA